MLCDCSSDFVSSAIAEGLRFSGYSAAKESYIPLQQDLFILHIKVHLALG
jgi:hypothetical protein